MLCEICGERKAVTTIEVDGVVLRVCSHCAKFGREVKEVKRQRDSKPTGFKEPVEEEVLPDFAERIRKAREKMKITREELAKMVGIRETLIEKYEKGKMKPEKAVARKLERVLNIVLIGKVSYSITGESTSEGPELTLGDVAKVRVKSRAR